MQIRERDLAKLLALNAVNDVEELRVPPGKRLEQVRVEREGQWYIRINQQFRICFAFEGDDAYDVEIVDYH